MKKRLTSRERVLACIIRFWREYGYPPTMGEIAQQLNFNSGEAVRYHLRALRSDGLIEWQEGAQRSIRLRVQV